MRAVRLNTSRLTRTATIQAGSLIVLVIDMDNTRREGGAYHAYVTLECAVCGRETINTTVKDYMSKTGGERYMVMRVRCENCNPEADDKKELQG